MALVVCFAGRAGQDTARPDSAEQYAARPDSAAQERLLEAMRLYAGQYVANLPNFICEQVTRQFEAGRKPNRWHAGDVLTSKLLFSNGQEERNLELVNGKPIRPGMRRWRTPLDTEGEFGILIDRVFSAASQASFTWKGWEAVGGKRTAVFDYAVDAEHSTTAFTLVDLARAVVAYHGTVYANPESGAIWRITDIENDLPKKLQTKSVSRSIDYDRVLIGEKRYLLPVQASIWAVTDTNNMRNELEFRNYRKFETDSVIKFASADEPAAGAGNPKD